jgi:hypothetical protein
MAVNQTLCDCIFEGKIAEGGDVREVKAKLCEVFKADSHRIDALFDGGPIVIRKGVDRATAVRYEAAFARVGAILRIVAVASGSSKTSDTGPLLDPLPESGRKNRYLERAKSYSDLRLLVEFTLVSFALQMLIVLPLHLSGLLIPDPEWDARVRTFIVGVVLGPPVETLLTQWLPIKVASRFTTRQEIQITVSALVFALLHLQPIRILWCLPTGFILAWIFVSKRSHSFKRAFWLTTALHALHNILVFLFLCFDSAMGV